MEIYEKILISGIYHAAIADDVIECSSLLMGVHQENLTYETMTKREKEQYRYICKKYLDVTENISQEIRKHINIILSQET